MRSPDGTIYLGLGEGDNSDEIKKIVDYINRRFSRFRATLPSQTYFGPELTAVIKELQGIYNSQGRLPSGTYISGVINKKTKEVIGYLNAPVSNIIHKMMTFTVEGHMSDMNVGPCAFTAQVLESEGHSIHMPTAYVNNRIPFHNEQGYEALVARLNATEFPTEDGRIIIFPVGTPFNLLGFSQGAMIACEVLEKEVLNPKGRLHYRLNDLRKVVMFGNPYRFKDAIASWVLDPPKTGTAGIMDVHFDATKYPVLNGRYVEHARTKDWYAENLPDEAGENMTAIAKIITQGNFTGGNASVWARIIDLFKNPPDGLLDIAWAVYRAFAGIIHLEAHGTYDLNPVIDWVRSDTIGV